VEVAALNKMNWSKRSHYFICNKNRKDNFGATRRFVSSVLNPKPASAVTGLCVSDFVTFPASPHSASQCAGCYNAYILIAHLELSSFDPRHVHYIKHFYLDNTDEHFLRVFTLGCLGNETKRRRHYNWTAAVNCAGLLPSQCFWRKAKWRRSSYNPIALFIVFIDAG
jgi:hypothetical protein